MRTPRPYQLEAVRAYEEYVSQPHDKWPILVLPTGTGKTFTASLIIKSVVERGGRVLWLTHRHKLAVDAADSIRQTCGDVVGFIGRGLGYDYKAQVIVAKKDTLRQQRHLSELETAHFDLMVVDEVHHWPSKTYRMLTAELSHDEMLGLTATPEREDKLRLDEHAHIIYTLSMLDAIEDEWILRPYTSVCKVPGLDLSALPQTRRDYVDAEQERELIRLHVADWTVEQLQSSHTFRALPFGGDEHEWNAMDGGGILVYCAGIEQAELTVAALVSSGASAEVLHSKMNMRMQEGILERFESGETQCIVNCGILTEGTDLPRAQTIVLARASTSWSLYIQMVGRVLRRYEGQDRAYVIDLVGATQHHSIVSAAILMGRNDCPESPDGKHRFLPSPTGGGFCVYCGHTIKCFVHRGGHQFDKHGECACGATQCPEAPGGVHHWIPWEAGVLLCPFCGTELPDPATALIGRVNPPPVKALWKKLRGKGNDVYGCHLGDLGILFNVGSGGLWRPLWVPPGKHVVQLSPRPIEGDMSRLITNDVARRAKKLGGYHGGQKNMRLAKIAWREVEQTARRLELWRI